jgi:hypothetical protein
MSDELVSGALYEPRDYGVFGLKHGLGASSTGTPSAVVSLSLASLPTKISLHCGGLFWLRSRSSKKLWLHSQRSGLKADGWLGRRPIYKAGVQLTSNSERRTSPLANTK